MATDQPRDLTAERVAIQSFYYCLHAGVEGGESQERYEQEDIGKIVALVHKTRQDALREAISKIRQRGDEYMRDCEAKDASGKKYRDSYEMRRVNSGRAWAFKDVADELDRLASEGG